MRTVFVLAVSMVLSSHNWAAEVAAPPRAARSVHLGYRAPDAVLFYNEMTVLQSTPGSYFMAAGWNTGYFGIQELSDGRKVILFSVWDPTKGDDPSAVKQEERVECLHQAPDVRIRRFGGEGTGGQCMGDFDWKIGETHRFAVTAVADGQKTAYAGYVWLNDRNEWKHQVTFRTHTGGQSLRGLYSFIEDFRRDGRSVHEVRRARFGNGWVKTASGEWAPLNRAAVHSVRGRVGSQGQHQRGRGGRPVLPGHRRRYEDRPAVAIHHRNPSERRAAAQVAFRAAAGKREPITSEVPA